jgi:hypothetical protein
MENEMKMMRDAYETMNKVVSNNRHRMIEKYARKKA